MPRQTLDQLIAGMEAHNQRRKHIAERNHEFRRAAADENWGGFNALIQSRLNEALGKGGTSGDGGTTEHPGD